MAFLNPMLALAGAAFIAVPILIVLLIHRRRLVLPWAAYHWMALALAKKKRKLRITEILKLISKLLLILAIAAAFGRPMVRLDRARRTLLIIDCSPSMATRLGEGTRLDRAKDIARRLVDASDGPVAISLLDDRLTPLSQFQTGRQALRQLISEVALSTRSGDIRALTDGILSDPALPQVEQLVIVSDFQRQWYGEVGPLSELASRLGAERGVTLLPVDSRGDLGNVGIVECRLPPEGAHRDRQNELHVQVRNFGVEAVNALPVTLMVGDDAQDRVLLDLPPGEAKWAHLTFQQSGASAQELAVRVPPDSYPLDDQILLSLSELRPRNVLGVFSPTPGQDGPDPDVFFRGALNAVGGSHQWNYRAIRPEQLATESLDGYDIIVLFGVPCRQGDPYAMDLRLFVEHGGGLIAFDDGETQSPWTALDVAAGEVLGEPAVPDRERLGDGVLGFMSDPQLAPGQIHFYRPRCITLGESAQGLLYVAGQKDPLIARTPLGSGQAVCAGFALFPGSTDLYYNPNVVQFMARLVWSVFPESPAHIYTPETLPELRVPGVDSSKRYALADGKGVRVPLRVGGTPQAPQLQLTAPQQPGFYSVVEGDQPVLRFAYNVTRQDSDVRCAADQLATKLADDTVSHHGQIRMVGDQELGRMTASRELIVAALVFLALAIVLENLAHLVLPGAM